MPGHAQLAQTGAPVLVIGGISYPIGGSMFATAAGLLCSGLLCIRFGFRRTLAADEATSTSTSTSPARHGK
ncbi:MULTISPECIES: hypothetical protein [unclassified Streptomyces]|uniref:hypothetical protein n=1 Tax=unclassified Streptomyces TaxID=2593676 RepID=UPI002DDC3383|nr:hypothetical protein [Streptomyces sp. NBC_01445]WSE02068.1 hypothetical protein OG574_00660 [Streptomyces sp. NBC_01445]WSE10262.1 hypothetical protein OG574_47350 [Streptomyces sp. NBC_01445]WSE11169.1 hypothetical protein OG574_48670 [Streptomyces sp. NBC_01445]